MQQKLDEAQAEAEQAIVLAPDWAYTHHCRSVVLDERKRFAMRAYDERHEPDCQLGVRDVHRGAHVGLERDQLVEAGLLVRCRPPEALDRRRAQRGDAGVAKAAVQEARHADLIGADQRRRRPLAAPSRLACQPKRGEARLVGPLEGQRAGIGQADGGRR